MLKTFVMAFFILTCNTFAVYLLSFIERNNRRSERMYFYEKNIVIDSLDFTYDFCDKCSCICLCAKHRGLPRENPQDVLTFVNGEENYDIYTEADSKSGGIKITYKGDGVVTEWEFPLSQNGKDYKPVSQGKNSITIVLLNQDKVLPYVNAIVSRGASSTVHSTTQKTTVSKRTTETDNTSSSTVKTSNEESRITVSVPQSEQSNDKELSNIGNNNKFTVYLIVICTVCVAAVVGIMIKRHTDKQS